MPRTIAASRTIALTGATGFIGSALAQYLHNAGWQIRALVRPSSKTRSSISGQRVEGALEDLDSLCRLVQGTYAVVHCAGAVRGITQAQFNQVNVAGVARLVQAAATQEPLPRFLSLSSLAAREPDLSPYAASKREGELALVAAAGNMRWAALRPPAVYGPGDKELLPLLQWMNRGIGLVLGPSEARFSLLYIDDLAAAVLRWLNGDCENGVFELHDGNVGGYRWDDVLDTIARLRAGPVRRVSVSAPMLRLLASISVLASRIGGFTPMLTPGKVGELRHPDWVCDNAALSRATGWAPRVNLEQGLRRTLGRSTRPVSDYRP